MKIQLKYEKIIKNIEKDIDDPTQLINNMNHIVLIARKNEHYGIFTWMGWEFDGYENREAIPHYRIISVEVHKEPSDLIAERDYEKTIKYPKSIKEVVHFSNYEWTKYKTTNIWGTSLTYYIQNTQFLKIIEGVKNKIKEYIVKIKRDLKSVKIDLSFIENKQFKEYQAKLLKEKLDISSGAFDDYLIDNNEKHLFTQNIDLLLKFEYERNYKFCMVMMGAIIEFLLKRLCIKKDIQEDKNFAFYLNAAIKDDVFQERMRWKLVQTHLRDFRNYIHIHKEMESTVIDENWYNTMKPVFEVLYKKFKLS